MLPKNPIGIHSGVFVGDWKPQDAERAIKGAKEAGYDLIERMAFQIYRSKKQIIQTMNQKQFWNSYLLSFLPLSCLSGNILRPNLRHGVMIFMQYLPFSRSMGIYYSSTVVPVVLHKFFRDGGAFARVLTYLYHQCICTMVMFAHTMPKPQWTIIAKTALSALVCL